MHWQLTESSRRHHQVTDINIDSTGHGFVLIVESLSLSPALVNLITSLYRLKNEKKSVASKGDFFNTQ